MKRQLLADPAHGTILARPTGTFVPIRSAGSYAWLLEGQLTTSRIGALPLGLDLLALALT